MNTNVVNVAIVDGKTITQATELRANPQGQPVRIKAVANGKYVLAEGDKGVAPEKITVKRVGKDLHVALEGTDPDQPQLIIEGFFDAQGQLVGVAEDGAYHAYIASDAEQDHEVAFLMDGVSSPQVPGSEKLGVFDGLIAATGMGWFWPALLGLGALAMIAHLLLTHALRLASAATLAPFTYLNIVFAGLVGWMLFEQVPDLPAMLGMAIIIASGCGLALASRTQP